MIARRRIGVDVGGTKAQGLLLGDDGTVERTEQRPTPRGVGSVEALLGAIEVLAGDLADGEPYELGVGVPGLVTRAGVLRAAPNLDGVADLDIAGRLTDRLGVRVAADNDATCAALAEWRLGAAAGVDDMMLVTLGTGIGGAIVGSGRLQRGRNGFAGEFGHMVVDPDGPRCPCGRRGCWERFASGSGLAMLAREAATGRRLRAVVEHAGGDPQSVRGEHVQAAARDGDAEALAVVDDFGRWVALGLANLTNAFDPAMFVLGGGLAAGADIYLGPIERWYAELLYQPTLRPLPAIRFARWGPLAGAVGAALLPGAE